MFLSDTNLVETNGTGRINMHQYGGESNYPKLMLYYTTIRNYCGNEANLQVNVVLFADLNGAMFPRTWLSLSKSRTWW